MCPWVCAAPIARVVEQRHRRIGAGKRPIIAHVDPQPGGIGLHLGHDGHGGIVAMQSLGGEDVRLDEAIEWHQRKGGGTDLVGKRRGAERNPLAGKALGLAIEGLMLPVLLEQQHGEEAGASPATRHDVEGRWRLCDRLAVPAGELLAHGLDDLPGPRDHVERLGDVSAKLRQPAAATGRARARRWHGDPPARQVFGKRLPGRPLAFEGGDGRGLLGRGFGCKIILGGVGLETFELQLRLVEQAACTLGAGAVLLAPELGDLQLEVRDHRLGGALGAWALASLASASLAR